MAEFFRYAAFISYSSRDAAFARRLHRALESYGIPSSLGKFDLIGGGKNNRIYPVFRDREELSAGQLGEQIEANLKASATLIVVCSPDGAASPWVQKEIEYFAGLERHEKIFAIIPDTAPLTDETGADCTQSYFPPAFRGDALTGDKLEPLAADARKGKDGFRSAWLKLVAGMIGVTPGQIIDRDKKRRAQQGMLNAIATLALILAIVGASSWVTTLAWRSKFSEQAAQSASEGNLLSAAAMALAGINGGGALMPARAAQADAVLSRVSGARVFGAAADQPPEIADANRDRHVASPAADISFSGDSATAAVVDRHGHVTLFDLRGAAPPLHAQGDQVILTARGDVAVALTFASDLEALNTLALVRKEGAAWRRENIGPVEDYRVSADGRFLAVVAPGNVARRYALDGGAPLELSGVRSLSLSGDGETLFAARVSGDSVALRGGVETPLGAVSQAVFLPASGGRIVTVRADGLLQARDLDAGGPPFDVGRFGVNLIFPPRLSRDGATLIVSAAPGRCLAFDLAERRTLRELGAECDLNQGEARVLIGRTRAGDYFAADMDSPTLVRALGRFTDAHYLPAVGMLVGETQGALMATSVSGSDARSFGSVSGWLIPDTGAHLLVQDAEAVSLYRLPDLAVMLRLAPLRYRRLGFSDDGGALVVEQRDGEASLYDLTHGKVRALGLIGGLRTEVNGVGRLGRITLSPDGRAMVVSNEDGTATLFDLAAPAPNVRPDGRARRGSDLAASVCATNGAAIPSFAAALREEGELAAALRGRPWHPCDWRGLLAIFPDASRGDGWFEGLRQWVRRMGVRRFDRPDYACGEINASGQTSTARMRMCRTAQVPDRTTN